MTKCRTGLICLLANILEDYLLAPARTMVASIWLLHQIMNAVWKKKGNTQLDFQIWWWYMSTGILFVHMLYWYALLQTALLSYWLLPADMVISARSTAEASVSALPSISRANPNCPWQMSTLQVKLLHFSIIPKASFSPSFFSLTKENTEMSFAASSVMYRFLLSGRFRPVTSSGRFRGDAGHCAHNSISHNYVCEFSTKAEEGNKFVSL